MNSLEEAFDQMLDDAEDVKGVREKVTFRELELDALFGAQTNDLAMAPGGKAESAPMTISLRLRDVVLPLEPLEAITIRGKALAVLSHDPREGRIDFFCGDPAAEME